MEENLNLNREIGVFGLSAHIVNMVVGSGIFVLPTIVFAGLGPSSIFAYLLCAILVAMVMLCFAEAGSTVTDSGGAYLYVRTAFGPYFGFLTAILFVMSTVAADAAVANAIIDVLGAKFSAYGGLLYVCLYCLSNSKASVHSNQYPLFQYPLKKYRIVKMAKASTMNSSSFQATLVKT